MHDNKPPTLSAAELERVLGGSSIGQVVGGPVGSILDRIINPIVIGPVLRRPPGSFPTEDSSGRP